MHHGLSSYERRAEDPLEATYLGCEAPDLEPTSGNAKPGIEPFKGTRIGPFKEPLKDPFKGT